MTPPSDGAPRVFATVTHARIRAAQGDLTGARRILDEILAEDPLDRDAHGLLESLGRARGQPRREEPQDEPLPEPSAGDPASLALRFRAGLRPFGDPPGIRVARLTAWLDRVRAARGRERSG